MPRRTPEGKPGESYRRPLLDILLQLYDARRVLLDILLLAVLAGALMRVLKLAGENQLRPGPIALALGSIFLKLTVDSIWPLPPTDPPATLPQD